MGFLYFLHTEHTAGNTDSCLFQTGIRRRRASPGFCPLPRPSPLHPKARLGWSPASADALMAPHSLPPSPGPPQIRHAGKLGQDKGTKHLSAEIQARWDKRAEPGIATPQPPELKAPKVRPCPSQTRSTAKAGSQTHSLFQSRVVENQARLNKDPPQATTRASYEFSSRVIRISHSVIRCDGTQCQGHSSITNMSKHLHLEKRPSDK